VIEARIAACNWAAVRERLDERGVACVPGLLLPDECADLADLYAREEGFRSRVVMSRHGFGRGEYRYFSYPLPAIVQSLRCSLYPRLAATVLDLPGSAAIGREIIAESGSQSA